MGPVEKLDLFARLARGKDVNSSGYHFESDVIVEDEIKTGDWDGGCAFFKFVLSEE